MRDLLFSYKSTLKKTKAMYKPLAEANESDLSAAGIRDKKNLRNMISDLEWTIDWLESGRQPVSRRSIDRRASRTVFIDPKIMEVFSNDFSILPEQTGSVTEEEQKIINDCLGKLTNREKEIFLLHIVEGFSYERISALLSIAKGTVQTTINRSRMKIARYINSNIKGA
ncbi:sigma-70 family RNA polymerase sigma factor [Bacillus velezensis]|uniref:sigma-70 family RNA polymerase sigma factor n=1 Tax=Bacillus amyloliquefaciens group TaxID=1938374 RepID=UPI00111EABB0|nr:MULTISPECIES: sigma-70 family RNA polymerase sigma factor [Bacillus amyloliquefaciens group]MCZ4248013.1 sigma-70 family RNA polymerase sigma factor [Bacillus amyloliquefaciens]MDX7894865.1 sigma-70 family RNA polymerase sigma factor [Bacillus velezensis]MDX8026302.1 sigma-70 family RNA polymerase sigma factor [Bacillus velezensis]MDX8199094.1 sigma-70 family RNA polymerase sigma factor [Bacillus velezensis]MDX8224864.1 sigma-70 family RNA polymerase sigma factor [Bacillus velezensis]